MTAETKTKNSAALLEVKGLKEYFPLSSKEIVRRQIDEIRAVDDMTPVFHEG